MQRPTTNLSVGGIPGITRSSLWASWKAIRRELRYSSLRDVVDWLDFDLDPDKWIKTLLRQISDGRYDPGVPARFTIGKSMGFSRTMTLPSVPDLVLYRTIVDFLYRRVKHKEAPHVYFKRKLLSGTRQAAANAARADMQMAAEYGFASRASFLNWLHYDQYRKHLLLEQVYPYFVITDISNFFDSVLHSHVEEAMRGLPVPARMTGLLFYILERLSIRQDYSSSHRISLPVDEFDCSRTLAHIVLFPHDRAVTRIVGEEGYVRWMDDQNVGVNSRAEGLQLLAEIGMSLGRLHLTPNTKKSRVLTLAEARRHFHLDLNRMLDDAEETARDTAITTGKRRALLRRTTRQIWARAQPFGDQGEFGKVLKRLYRLAGIARARFLRRRARADVLSDPKLADRISDYMRVSGTPLEFVSFVESVMSSPEQVYSNVSVALAEGLLRTEAEGYEARRIRVLGTTLLTARLDVPGSVECQSIAPLVLLRFGDRRSFPMLLRMLADETGRWPSPVIRSLGLVVSSFGAKEFQQMRRVASRLLRNYLADVVLLIERIQQYDEVPARFHNRLKPRFDSVQNQTYVDMRSLLTVRLLDLNGKPKVQSWINDWKAAVLTENLSSCDQRLINRLLR